MINLFYMSCCLVLHELILICSRARTNTFPAPKAVAEYFEIPRQGRDDALVVERTDQSANAACQYRPDGMAGYEGDDDEYGDDDLDALPDDTLIELENNAIQFTQAQTQAARAKAVAPSSDYGDEFDENDFDEEIVIDESRSTPVIAPSQRNIPGQITPQEQFRQQRYGTINNSNTITQLANRPRPTPPRFDDTTRIRQPVAIPLHDSVVAEQGSQPSASSDVKVESLQKQVEEVMAIGSIDLTVLIDYSYSNSVISSASN